MSNLLYSLLSFGGICIVAFILFVIPRKIRSVLIAIWIVVVLLFGIYAGFNFLFGDKYPPNSNPIYETDNIPFRSGPIGD